MERINDLYGNITPETLEGVDRFKNNLLRAEDREVPESAYEKLFDKYEPKFLEALESLLELWKSPEHQQTLGHDTIHISYDLLEYLHLIEGLDLPKSERYMILFGSLLHDLGRYPELLIEDRSEAMDFNKNIQIQNHAAMSAFIGLRLAKDFKDKEETDPEIITASQAFNRRVIGAALYHGGKNVTEDPIIHHVQSIDRLAGILGSREFVRNLVTDGVQRGAALYPDENLDYSEAFPLFSNLPVTDYSNSKNPKESYTNILHYIEMPARNIFPLSSQAGTERAKEMRRESGIILSLMSGDEGTSLYQQVFAPELNPDHSYSFPKTKMPEDIWQEIKKGPTKEEREAMDKNDLSTAELVNLMLDQQAPFIKDEDRQKVHALIASAPEKHQRDIVETIKYVISRHELNRKKERAFLLSKKDDKDHLVSHIADDLLHSPLFV